MADRLDRALREGRAPAAPGFVGWAATLGGLGGAALAAGLADWEALAQLWSGGFDPKALTAMAWVPVHCAGGALAGAFLGRRALGPARWAARLRWRPLPAPRGVGLLALVFGVAGAALAGAVAPALVPAGDPGWALVVGALCAAVCVGLALSVPALVERGRARQRWAALVDPQPPPRHDDDELPPAVRAALRARPAPARERLKRARLLLTCGDYAVAVGGGDDRAPRVIAHGGPELLATVALRVVESPALADALAATPAGEPAPAATWPALRALLSDLPAPPSAP